MRRYSKTRFIGSGAYSNVYEAIDKETRKKVALKISKLNRSEGMPATSLREICILKTTSHPNILKLLNVVHEKKVLCLVFEYMDYDLKVFLETHRVDVVPYIYQLLCGLNALHEKNIIHRDLKPQNILVDRKGNLKIGDFGLGRSIDLELPHLASEVVTLWYRSPELLQKSTNYYHYVDMWSVGCIIVEMISGEVLFSGKSNEDQLETIHFIFRSGLRKHVIRLIGHIPQYLMDIITGCLEIEVSQRLTVRDCLNYMERKF